MTTMNIVYIAISGIFAFVISYLLTRRQLRKHSQQIRQVAAEHHDQYTAAVQDTHKIVRLVHEIDDVRVLRRAVDNVLRARMRSLGLDVRGGPGA